MENNRYAKKLNILFCVASLGLGHATRTLPLIEFFKNQGHKITVLSYAKALDFLKKELSDEKIEYISFEDYPKLERGKGLKFYYYLITDLMQTTKIIKKEKEFLKNREFDLIISDGRYGFNSKHIPSFLISHQISFIPPKALAPFKFISDIGNIKYFKNFHKVLIPDFKEKEFSLAGKLSHNYLTKFFNYEYVGILSSYKKIETNEKIDYLFIISGYLDEHKDSFVSKLINQAKNLEGKKVFILGDTSKKDVLTLENNITIYPIATSNLRKKLFNCAEVIISRTGYTTIMDLIEMDKKGILFPTPNQTEQEYLAKYHSKKNWFITNNNDKNFNLKEMINNLNKTKPHPKNEKTKDSIEKIKNIIDFYLNESFFSIIIPAFNEEKYIVNTLNHITNLNYTNYEVIIVENGSTDNTYKIAKQYENEKIKVIKSKKGVSIAKNEGIKHISKNSEYTIFLDADTIIEKNFLKELNLFLKEKNYVIGTTSIKPYNSNSKKDKLWYKFYDISHKITQTSYSIQIIKSDLLKNVKFDEELNFSEDIKFIKDAKKYGKFFFFNTNSVATSTRRFKKDGYIKTLIKWSIQANLPEFLKKNSNYNPIR